MTLTEIGQGASMIVWCVGAGFWLHGSWWLRKRRLEMEELAAKSREQLKAMEDFNAERGLELSVAHANRILLMAALQIDPGALYDERGLLRADALYSALGREKPEMH